MARIRSTIYSIGIWSLSLTGIAGSAIAHSPASSQMQIEGQLRPNEGDWRFVYFLGTDVFLVDFASISAPRSNMRTAWAALIRREWHGFADIFQAVIDCDTREFTMPATQAVSYRSSWSWRIDPQAETQIVDTSGNSFSSMMFNFACEQADPIVSEGADNWILAANNYWEAIDDGGAAIDAAFDAFVPHWRANGASVGAYCDTVAFSEQHTAPFSNDNRWSDPATVSNLCQNSY